MTQGLRLTAVLALALHGCSGGQAPMDECERGATVLCVGADGCVGERSCSGTPTRWTECRCEAEADLPTLGGHCDEDRDCPDDAFCLGPDSTRLFGGAPSSGTCVADCAVSPTKCEGFERAVCVSVDATAGTAEAGEALCFPRCTLGTSSGDKCGGADHVACAPVGRDGEGEGFCRPLCATDEDCDVGLCDARVGVCTRNAPRDRTFGTHCDIDAMPSACDALCVTLNEAPALCSRRCVFGSLDECAPASGGLRRGACAFVTEGGSIGDLGYCAELCDCNDDCTDPAFVCDSLGTASARAFNRSGVCTTPDLVLGDVLECE